MADTDRNLSARELYATHMEENWGTYLNAMESLPVTTQESYAKSLEYSSYKAMLASLCLCFRHALDIIPSIARGQTAESVDTSNFERKALDYYQNQEISAVKDDLDNLQSAFGGMIAELPDEAFRNPDVMERLDHMVHELYEEHLPPGEPRIPADAYGGERH